MAKRETELNRDQALASEGMLELTSLASSADYLVKMVNRYAQELQKSRAPHDQTTDSEAAQFDSILADIGVANLPSKSSSSYHLELCKMIEDSVSKAFQTSSHKMMLLSDLYCLVNRARITNLISPNDVHAACSLLRKTTSVPGASTQKLILKQFPSGALVLLSAEYSDEKLVKKIEETLRNHEPATLSFFADALSMSYALVEAQLSYAEAAGVLCRDETLSNTFFYLNRFL